MIEKLYIEKMHQEIDDSLTETEQKKLHRYLEANPEAKKLYEDLLQTAQLLGDMPEVEPSPNMIKYIMNSISPKRYAPARTSLKTKSFFPLWLAKPLTKMAFAFSLGSVIGILVYSAITQQWTGPHSMNATDFYGTIGVIGPKDSDLSKVFHIAASDIHGTVTATKGKEHFTLLTNLKTGQPTEVSIEYDLSSLHYSGFSTTKRTKFSLDPDLNDIRISFLGNAQFNLYFNRTNADVVSVTVHFFANGEWVYTQVISL